MNMIRLLLLLATALVMTVVVFTRVPVAQNWLLGVMGERAMNNQFTESDHLKVFVCGSASPLGNSVARSQACIAIVTPKHFYLFDVGAGSANKVLNAGLPYERLDGVFLTHFHSDHIADLPEARLFSWVAGRAKPLQVFGPTGVEEVVTGFNRAYRYDSEYRTRHHGEDLLPPSAGQLQAVSGGSGVVLDRDGLQVTQFKVQHDPVEPAVGYRVDYQGRSIVISGDSIVSENLFKHAAGVDLLFHDALSPKLTKRLSQLATEAGRDRVAQVMLDVLDYHADVTALEAASQEANVAQLVLYHMVPTPNNPLLERMWQQEISDSTILSDDGMVFELPAGSRELVIRR